VQLEPLGGSLGNRRVAFGDGQRPLARRNSLAELPAGFRRLMVPLTISRAQNWPLSAPFEPI